MNNEKKFDLENKRMIAQEGEYKFTINESTENSYEKIEERFKQQIKRGVEKYMPIGSVVSLIDSNVKYMIIGFNYINENDKYDYLACFYPFGIDVKHDPQKFNHNQIDKIYHIGYINKQEEIFKDSLDLSDNKQSRR